MDALLRLRGAGSEAEFWASARGALLRADNVSLALTLLNNALIAYTLSAIGEGPGLARHLRMAAAMIAAQLLAAWCARAHTGQTAVVRMEGRRGPAAVSLSLSLSLSDLLLSFLLLSCRHLFIA